MRMQPKLNRTIQYVLQNIQNLKINHHIARFNARRKTE